MKKLTYLSYLILLNLIVISCSREEVKSPIETLESTLLSLEMEVYSGVLYTMSPETEIINRELFSTINKLRSAETERDYFKITESFDYSTKGKIAGSFSLEEETIFRSLFNLSRDRISEEKLNICDLYLSELPVMNLNDEVEDNVEFIIIAYRDLITFLYQIDKGIQYVNQKGVVKWDCKYLSCFDCCFSSKMQEIADGNWIDVALFLSAFYINVPATGASCAWDCIRQ